MGLSKDELAKLIQATIMAICEHSVTFKKQILVQAVIFLEVDDDKYCSVSFREKKAAKTGFEEISSRSEAGCPVNDSLIKNNDCQLINADKEKENMNHPMIFDREGCDHNSEKDKFNDSFVTEELSHESGSFLNGSVMNNMFAEAMRMWYNEPSDAVPNNDQPSHVPNDIFGYDSDPWRSDETVALEISQGHSNSELSTKEKFTLQSKRTGSLISSVRRLHRCDICGKEFTFSTNLSRHRKAFHGKSGCADNSFIVDKREKVCDNDNGVTYFSQQEVVGSQRPLKGSENTDICFISNAFSISNGSDISTASKDKTELVAKIEPLSIISTYSKVDSNKDSKTSQPDVSLVNRSVNVKQERIHTGYSRESENNNKHSSINVAVTADCVALSPSSSKGLIQTLHTTTPIALEPSLANINHGTDSLTSSSCFKCDLCGESFVRESNLQRHIQFYHRADSSVKEKSLAEHDLRNHGNLLSQSPLINDGCVCSACGKKFLNPTDCKRHFSLAHKKLGAMKIESRSGSLNNSFNNLRSKSKL